MISDTFHKRILCIHKDSLYFPKFYNILKESNFFAYKFDGTVEAMAHIYNDPPDLILLCLDVKGWKDLLLQLKTDPVYSHLPVIIIIPETYKTSILSLKSLPIDDWMLITDSSESLLLRVSLKELHASRHLDANPLTRLPGNFTILTTIQDCINKKMKYGLGYLDIDNFKAFNDKYGFARGDDMIRMTARIIANVVKRLCPKDGFVGHIGGDDFVFIVSSSIIEKCCQDIIQNFDLVSTTLTNDEDRILGYIECEDRQGKFRKFPLPTISIAAINSEITLINHTGEAASIAGEIKKEVKKRNGSNYFLERRNSAVYKPSANNSKFGG